MSTLYIIKSSEILRNTTKSIESETKENVRGIARWEVQKISFPELNSAIN